MNQVQKEKDKTATFLQEQGRVESSSFTPAKHALLNQVELNKNKEQKAEKLNFKEGSSNH